MKARFDRENQIPIVRRSICTGERTAGFKDRDTGKFHDIMLITSENDLKQFMREYCIMEIKEEY